MVAVIESVTDSGHDDEHGELGCERLWLGTALSRVPFSATVADAPYVLA
jgi:hypothetical protein